MFGWLSEPGQPRLAQEALREARVVRPERLQLLERDEPVEVDLAREVHDGHPAPAELLDHLVSTDNPFHRAPCSPPSRPILSSRGVRR